MASAEVVKFNPNNGQPLKPGETVTFEGKTYTGGSTAIAGTPTKTTSTTTSQPKTTTSSSSSSSSSKNTSSNTSSSSFALSAGNLAVGSSGTNVSQLQQALNDAGANPPLVGS